MQHEAQEAQENPERSARLFLGMALIGVGGFLAWGYARVWSGPPASEEGRALAEQLRSVAPWMGASVCGLLGLFALGLMRGGIAISKRGGELWPAILVLLAVALGARALGEPGAEMADAAGSFEVEVIGQQFEWLVRYPGPDGTLGRVDASLVHVTLNPAGLDAEDPMAADDVLLRQRLWLPAGERCVVHLRSLDVIHSFNVEDFRLRRELVPGSPTRVEFVTREAGQHELSCASLCGLGHYRMSATINVVPRAELDAWLASQEAWL